MVRVLGAHLRFSTVAVLCAPALRHMQTHIAPHTLRVCVLDGMASGEVPKPHELAWNYDLVITTFG